MAEPTIGGSEILHPTRNSVSSGRTNPTDSDGLVGFPGQTLKVLPENLTGAYNPGGVVYDPPNGELYVADVAQLFVQGQPWAITAVNPTTGREIAQFPLVTPENGLVVDPLNGDVLVGGGGAPGNITVINATTNQISFPTNLGFSAALNLVLASDPVNGNTLYFGAPATGPSSLILVNGSDFQNMSMTWLPDGWIYGAAFDPANGEVYVSAGWAESNLTILNANNLSLISNIRHVPRGPCLFDAANDYLYVAGFSTWGVNNDAGTLTILNTVTNRVVSQLAVGNMPVGIALDPINGYLYVANQFSSNISVINTQTNQLVGSFNVTPYPYGIAYDSASQSLFIPDLGGDGVGGNADALIEVFPNYTPYSVTFTAQGLPVGANWSVAIDHKTESARGGTSISFSEFNGNYTFVVNGSGGWIPTPSSGTVNLSGAPQTIPIRFQSPYSSLQGSDQPQPWPISWVMGLFAGLAIFAGLIGVGAVVYYRKLHRTPPR